MILYAHQTMAVYATKHVNISNYIMTIYYSLSTDTNHIFNVFIYIKKFSDCNNTDSKRQEIDNYKMRRLSTKQKNSQEVKLLYTDIIKSQSKCQYLQ